MKYIYSSNNVKFIWTVWKQANTVREDFTGANLKVILYGPFDKYALSIKLSPEGDIESNEYLPANLPPGVYSMKAFWTKHAARNYGRVLMTEQNCFAAFTNNADETDGVPASRTCVLRMQSAVATYGKDGLSAYEIAVLHGETTLNESDWIRDISNIADNEQERCDNEADRQFNEAHREQNEAVREENEYARQEAEKARGGYKDQLNDLQHQIDSIQAHGVAVSKEFGTDDYISVSQKTLTDAITKIWSKLEDITGEALQGIYMQVTPEFFISETGADVHITATTVETNGKFEHIAFYLNGELLEEADNVESMETDTHIDETTIVKCVAKIMGIEYEKEKKITKYNEFWLGSGHAYTDIMDDTHSITLTNGMRVSKDVVVREASSDEDEQYIFVVMRDTLSGGFIRADLNGFEIPFEEFETIVNGVKYIVYQSINDYQAGTYNIDING